MTTARPLRDALRERGFHAARERLVELWRMLYEVHQIFREISIEIDETERESNQEPKVKP